MKVTDYAGIVEKLSNPDTAAEGLVDLDAQLKKDEEDYNKIFESNNTLRDTNSKLALRITGAPTGQQEQNQEPQSETPAFDLLQQKLSEMYK